MRLLLLLLIAPLPLWAFEEKPWFEQPFDVILRADGIYETYTRIDSDKGNFDSHVDAPFIRLSANVSPWQDIDAEVEWVLGHTTNKDFDNNTFGLMGRYLFYDDLMGDFASVSIGLSGRKVWKRALRDPATFYHAQLETELHAAIGREVPLAPIWISRMWALLAWGIGDVGSPWYRANFAWEHNLCDCHQVRLFVDSLWGAGHKAFPVERCFKGYGSLDHRSVDVGIRYAYQIPYFGEVGVSYVQRVFAHNAPSEAHYAVFHVAYHLGF